jgi:hypothetical protein
VAVLGLFGWRGEGAIAGLILVIGARQGDGEASEANGFTDRRTGVLGIFWSKQLFQNFSVPPAFLISPWNREHRPQRT